MLIDTNIIVDLFRGYKPAGLAFNNLLHGQNASIVTKYELIVGAGNKKDLEKMLKGLNSLGINFEDITPEISEIAESILKNFHHKYGVTIEDAIISATAIINGEELATRNVKHFSFIPNLKFLKPY